MQKFVACVIKNNSQVKDLKKVRHYCHFSGSYRGAAHSISNFRYSVPPEISVVFPNV